MHEAYLTEAVRLRALYASRIHLLVGFEGEWYGLHRAASYAAAIRSLASDPRVDYFIGSLHHVHTVPIDYSPELYAKAVQAAGGSEEQLYEAYYDAQFDMLTELKPLVVGHFDLVRLMSAEPGRDVKSTWPHVWEKMKRNLAVVVAYGGWLECNSSALRKGLAEPYPGRGLAEEFVGMGGKFTISDDSHGLAQVATNYMRAIEYLESLGVKEVWTLERRRVGNGQGDVAEKSVFLEEFKVSLKIE
jgi:histidinol-phosphatase (PHP family)